MYNNNIPQNGKIYTKNYYRPPMNQPIRPNDGDRFFGGGFLGPFLLGGVGGYLLGRPNYNYGGPIPVFFPNNTSYPVPYPVPYSTTNYYY